MQALLFLTLVGSIVAFPQAAPVSTEPEVIPPVEQLPEDVPAIVSSLSPAPKSDLGSIQNALTIESIVKILDEITGIEGTSTKTVEAPILSEQAAEAPIVSEQAAEAPIVSEQAAEAPIVSEQAAEAPIIAKSLHAPVESAAPLPSAAVVPAVSAPVIPAADVGKATAEFYKAYQAAFASNVPNVNVHRFGAPVMARWAAPVGFPVRASVPVAAAAQVPWTGPLAATIPASLPGSSINVAETADVQAATAEFYRAYQAAIESHNPRASQRRFSAPLQARWTGPLAATVPAGLPGSTANIANTADVQAANAAFGQAFQQQLRTVFGRV